MSTNCTSDMGLGTVEIKDITNQWHTNMITAKSVAVAAKGFNWQLLLHASTPRATGAQCEAFFRRACAPHSQEYDSALMVGFAPKGKNPNGRAPNFLADLATFLLIRGPHAWIGHDFVGCSLWDEQVGGPGQLFERPPLLDTLQVGAPLARSPRLAVVCSRGSGRAHTPRSIATRRRGASTRCLHKLANVSSDITMMHANTG